MHIDTLQAIFLGVTATLSSVVNGYIGADQADIIWYSSANRTVMQLLAALVCGVLGAFLGTGISLVACHFFPGSVIASIVALVLVFPASFIIWLLIYLPDFVRAMRKLGRLT